MKQRGRWWTYNNTIQEKDYSSPPTIFTLQPPKHFILHPKVIHATIIIAWVRVIWDGSHTSVGVAKTLQITIILHTNNAFFNVTSNICSKINRLKETCLPKQLRTILSRELQYGFQLGGLVATMEHSWILCKLFLLRAHKHANANPLGGRSLYMHEPTLSL